MENNVMTPQQGDEMADAIAAQGNGGAGMFGIDANLQASNSARFKGGIHKTVLLNVVLNTIKKKDGTETKALQFTFVDLDNVRKFIHTEWTVDPSDAKFGKKLEALNIRFKHIYEAYSKFPEAGLGKGATTFVQYLELLAIGINTGKAGKPIYKTDDGKLIPVYIKLTYFNNNLGFPYSPNFLEVIKEGKETTLTIDKRYDTVEQTDAPSGNTMPGIVIPSDNEFL